MKEGNRMGNNIVCIVQARMGSKRLPGKVIKEIKGIPMIVHLLNRLKKVEKLDKVIVATSTNPENDQLAAIVEKAGGLVFKGSEEDVLRRYLEAVNAFGGDYIIRVTGDCPLISWEVLDALIEEFLKAKVDYMRVDVPDTFCRGFDGEIFTKEALIKAHQLAKEERYREHVTLYMYEHPQDFTVARMKAKKKWSRPDYRLCVDTKEDFAVVEAIYNALYDYNPYFTIDDIISYLDRHPELSRLNQSVRQKKV